MPVVLDAWFIRVLCWATRSNRAELETDWRLALASRASGPWSPVGRALINYFAGCYLVAYVGLLVVALVLVQPTHPVVLKASLGAAPALFGYRALLYGVWFRMDLSRRPDRNRAAVIVVGAVALSIGEILAFQVR